MASSSHHRRHLTGYLDKHKNKQHTNTVGNSDSSPSGGGGNSSSTRHTLMTPGNDKKSTKPVENARAKGGRNTTAVTNSRRRPPPLIKGKATIEHLPYEIMLEIFSRLEAQDLLKAACVCKRWHKQANDNLLWEKIFRTHGTTVKDEGGKPLRPPLEYWKQLCIKRCTEKRNKTCLKLLKKMHPYTGLPRFTEKALRCAGVWFQLCLIDSDGKEHESMTCDVFHHSMSIAVRWYSLTNVPLNRIKQLKVFSCNPLFFDDKGHAVRNGPYQRSLMTSTDLKWSVYVKDTTPVAANDTIVLYAVPASDLLVATWKADGELAFVAVGYHHLQLVHRCLLGTIKSAYPLPGHTPVPDDIDPSYGLHDYRCTVDIRNMRSSLWTQQFQGLHCRKQDVGDGYAYFRLIRKDHTGDHVIIPKQFSLPWKTDLFKGIIKNIAWLDLTLLDERETVFWSFSSPLTAQAKEKTKNLDFDYNGDNHLAAMFSGEKGQVHIELNQMDDDRTFVSCLEVRVALSAINEWFETCY
ncbi:F-box only protein 15-like [Haliotis rubra]|uniref:F-box only protein 15-like n=1 Tax=Haliotis rubra TaxID=36100 RepID=UPI001EE5F4D3|nr:F-box only protein 15-like [Haliotis rubra]